MAQALLAQEHAERRAEAAELAASRREVAAQKAALTALQASGFGRSEASVGQDVV